MLFSKQFLQVCKISKESEEVRGNDLMIWHGMTRMWDNQDATLSIHAGIWHLFFRTVTQQ